MSIPGRIIFITILTWVPVLILFYLPNTYWGITLKIIAGIFLISIEINLVLGNLSKMLGSAAGAGFMANTALFTITLIDLPLWANWILWILIIIGWATCYRILKEMQEVSDCKA
jgi:hypothetical protein